MVVGPWPGSFEGCGQKTTNRPLNTRPVSGPPLPAGVITATIRAEGWPDVKAAITAAEQDAPDGWSATLAPRPQPRLRSADYDDQDDDDQDDDDLADDPRSYRSAS